jgi:hypothetical protein
MVNKANAFLKSRKIIQVILFDVSITSDHLCIKYNKAKDVDEFRIPSITVTPRFCQVYLHSSN